MDNQHIENANDTVEKQDEKKTNETWEWLKALLVAVIIAVLIRVFVFAPIVVDGESMIQTLDHKERLIVNKAVYFINEPRHGDIIVFHATEDKDWIKRVIGEPGDIVEAIDGVLYVNGEVIEEPYLNSDAVTHDFYTEVPENQLFVMGDNRTSSRDSRHIGSVPIENVIGRADLSYWPLTNIRLIR